MPTPAILATIPVLPSSDLAQSVAFYAQLGFAQIVRNERYAIVGRDGAQIHFSLSESTSKQAHLTCHIRVASADALFREFSDRGLQLDPPADRSWDIKELKVVDPDGNLIKFGEPIEDHTLQFEARR